MTLIRLARVEAGMRPGSHRRSLRRPDRRRGRRRGRRAAHDDVVGRTSRITPLDRSAFRRTQVRELGALGRQSCGGVRMIAVLVVVALDGLGDRLTALEGAVGGPSDRTRDDPRARVGGALWWPRRRSPARRRRPWRRCPRRSSRSAGLEQRVIGNDGAPGEQDPQKTTGRPARWEDDRDAVPGLDAVLPQGLLQPWRPFPWSGP